MPASMSSLLPKDLEILESHGNIVNYKPREIILHQEATSRKFYLIKSGVVQIDFSRVYGTDVLAYLGEGDFFGEISFLDELQISATASAAKPCELLEIPHETLRTLLDADDALAARFYRTVATALARRIRISNQQ